MPIYNQAGQSISNTQTLTENVRLTATNITFTNTELGRILAQFFFDVGGSTLVNDVGGYIGAGEGDDPWTYEAIFGSSGADTIIDRGTIAGLIDLGAGNDTLISDSAGSTYATTVFGANMGDGDDLLRFEGSTAPFFVYGNGGEGTDTFEFAATTNQVYGTHLTGFEILSLRAGGNYSEFSGYTQIVGAAGMLTGIYNLVDSLNPLADISLAGSWWGFQRSTAASLTGGDQGEIVWFGFTSTISGAISLGGGDDGIDFSNGATVTSVGATAIDGGAGDADTLSYFLTGAISDSLSTVTGFERLRLTNGTDEGTAAITLSDISGFTSIYAESAVDMTFLSGDITGAEIGGSVGGSIFIADGVTVASYFYGAPGWPVNTGLTAPNFTNSTVLTNEGAITGGVIFYDGDDLYDGINGSVGGAVRGNAGNDTLIGGVAADEFHGDAGADTLRGNGGDDLLFGGAGTDTAIFSGLLAAYSVTHISSGVFEVVGADGTDLVTDIEFLQFDDELLRLRPGPGETVDFSANAATYMSDIRDYDGNALGGNEGWLWIGAADVNGDGDLDQILVNDTIGRFATIDTAPDGLVYFDDHGRFGETRVVGIYIDPLVASREVEAGSEFDSQARFRNDLEIENINGVLGADDYDGDGIWEVYFALTDGTAYLRAFMHADGNIRYANYQSEQQMIDYLTANGYNESTYGSWLYGSGAQEDPASSGKASSLLDPVADPESSDKQDAGSGSSSGSGSGGGDGWMMPGDILAGELALASQSLLEQQLHAEFFG
ncbi:calcium-binding protein [Altererythrobacter sp. GH1-8]|uniref:calcium-binding protein n=1 Tax=Altererythrobacter sp. GH1-8 TaxID=3349333 RepID=UPI00374C8EB7